MAFSALRHRIFLLSLPVSSSCIEGQCLIKGDNSALKSQTVCSGNLLSLHFLDRQVTHFENTSFTKVYMQCLLS